jgi:hypothetical protein
MLTKELVWGRPVRGEMGARAGGVVREGWDGRMCTPAAPAPRCGEFKKKQGFAPDAPRAV